LASAIDWDLLVAEGDVASTQRLTCALCRHSSVVKLTSTFCLTEDVPNGVPMVVLAVLLTAGSVEHCLSRLWSIAARMLSLKLSRRTVASALASRGPGCPAK